VDGVDARRLSLKHAIIPAKAGIQADAPATPPGPMSRATIFRPLRPSRWTQWPLPSCTPVPERVEGPAHTPLTSANGAR